MKKTIFYCLIAFLALFLIGCEPSEKDPSQGGGQEETKFEEQFNEISLYINENTPKVICEDIELIGSYDKYGAYIEWISSDEEIMSFSGEIYPNKTKALEVTLTYNVQIGADQKSGTLDVVVSPVSMEEIANRFGKQFSITITRDYTVKEEYYDLFTVEWISTNANVFTNEGKYIKPDNDTEFEIKYVVKCKDLTSEEYSVKLTAMGQSDLEKIEEITNWLKTEGMLELYLTEEVVLPTVYERLNIPITWKSTNPDVVSSDGVITHYVFERYVTLIAEYDLGNGVKGTSKYECVVSPLDTTNMSEKEILENFLSAIALNEYSGVKFSGNGDGCNTTFGHLNFYLNKETEVIANMAPTTNRNYTGVKCDVKFVIVHDTGNMNSGATAKANSNYCIGGAAGSTGWHYTTGNDGVYQQFPEGMVAYHAHGGAYDYAEMIKTNVKATWQKPNITVSEDGYIMFNNMKSDYKVPKVGAPLASDGPVVEVGEDGYYYISRLYYSSLSTNSVRGGNANSIGIESCVNSGSDYLLTCRKTAKLVAELCMRHDVDMKFILQHNTTSGKDCPSAMRATNFWYTFKDWVSMERFAKTYLTEYEFIWTGNGDIDNTGVIKLGTTATEVSYSVVVKKDGADFLNKSFTTIINK